MSRSPSWNQVCSPRLPSIACAPKRVVAHAESGCVVEEPGEPVENRVDVGADQEAPELLVVGGVGHDGQVLRGEDAGEACRQTRTTGSAGEQGHPHRKRSSSEGRTSC